jgi:hypothetical protein
MRWRRCGEWDTDIDRRTEFVHRTQLKSSIINTEWALRYVKTASSQLSANGFS